MPPLVELKDIYKIYRMGDSELHALDGISLTIEKGEFVAIVGQSGSGKSTCMNIIGCLDVPTKGSYFLNGRDISGYSDDELAEVRNKMLGFIFQQYNLIPKLTVLENVELPLLYGGFSDKEQRERAMKSLERVGLADKAKNLPSQLSGGQQQRVSIARALAGDPSVILADEPTGALDSKTGREVMRFLQRLHSEGNTIVLITHDNSIAARAKRVVRITDGRIVYDGPAEGDARCSTHPRRRGGRLMGFHKCFLMALSSIWNNKMRSFLTMLGIIIGIAAVIILVSVMNGLTGQVTSTFQEMGTKTITVNIRSRSTTKKVDPEEMFDWADSRRELFDAVSPTVTMSGTLKTSSSGDDTVTSTCTGVSEQYADMKDIELSFGRFLQYIDCERELKNCVIGTYQALYFWGSASAAMNKELKINGVPYKIVGVLEQKEDSSQSSEDDIVYLPYTTAKKANGSAVVSSYLVTAVSEEQVTNAVSSLKELMQDKIGDSNYYTVTSMLSMIDTMSGMMDSMKMVLVAIAAISLLVGGIGIMNIMLVSVTERTREIGIRKSLGAKHRHILLQFVIEAGTVSCMGGIFGIILGCAVSLLAGGLLNMNTSPSVGAIALAFGVSVGIGVAFGFLPARKAARLNPIDALRFE